jgi:hypothetical protein
VVKSDGKILLLEHVRIDTPIIGWIMDRLNFMIVRIVDAKRVIARPNKEGTF